MAVRRKKKVLWSASDLKALKSLARKQSAKRIAKALKRSVIAVRVKASERGWSLRVPAA